MPNDYEVDPGLTLVHHRRPDERDTHAQQADGLVSVYGAVARTRSQP